MTRWTSLVALVALLQGCATQLAIRPEAGLLEPEVATATAVLKFQRKSIAPADGETFLAAEALRPGDILLTSAPTLRSAGIQLATFAPVSHAAIYIGNGEIVEAVLPGVRARSLDEALKEESVVLVLRHPELTAEQAQLVKEYALSKSGAGFNIVGITLQFPFSIGRKVCEVPLVPSAVRDVCIRSLGLLNQVGTGESRLFCSQLVLQAYRHAGLRITRADPRLISPADILHMREGDVSSVKIRKPLRFVGHLKYERPVMVAFQQ